MTSSVLTARRPAPHADLLDHQPGELGRGIRVIREEPAVPPVPPDHRVDHLAEPGRGVPVLRERIDSYVQPFVRRMGQPAIVPIPAGIEIDADARLLPGVLSFPVLRPSGSSPSSLVGSSSSMRIILSPKLK